MKKGQRWLVIMALLLNSCAATGGGLEQAVAVRTLAAPLHCGAWAAQPALHWLDDSAAYQALGRALNPSPVQDRSHSLPVVDFRHSRVVLLGMGSRPSSGYALELLDSVIDPGQEVLRLVVRYQEPPPDALTAQVLTSPCLLLAVERGKYRRIEVVDESGHIRHSVGIP